MKQRLMLRSLPALLLAVALTACAPGLPSSSGDLSGGAEPPGDVSSAPPQTPVATPFTLAYYPDYGIHPVRADNRANLTLAPLLYEGLFTVDAAFQAQGVLCSSYSASPDALVWHFQLRPGVTFSDGSPLTGAAAAAALTAAQGPDSQYAQRLSGVKSIAADQDSVTLTLSAPNGSLPLLLDIPISLGDGNAPLGTGPYVLVQGEDGAPSLSARPDWWQGKPTPFPTILLSCVSQADDLISAFDTGDVTLLDSDLTGTNSLGYSGSYEAWDYATTTLLYLGFQTQKGSCKVPEVRQALARGVDRQAIADTSFAHHAAAAALPVHPDSALYHRALADAAAFSPEALTKGLTEHPLDNRALVLLVNSENSSKVAAAQRIVSQLEELGLSVTLKRLPWPDYLAALAEGAFDLFLGEVRLTADFNLAPLVGSGGALNYGGWSNPDTDLLLSAFLAADPQGRPAAAGALYAHLIQQAPIVPICFKNGSVLTQWGRLTGLSPVRGNIFQGLDRWVLNS